jgi:hypothetical protein
MPIFEIEANGKTYEVEAPSMEAAAAAVAPHREATPPPASATIGMMAPSTATSEPPTGTLMDLIPPREERRRDMQAYEGSLSLAVPTPAPAVVASAAKGAPGVIARAAGISKARAGQNIEQAVTAAKDVAVNTTDDLAKAVNTIMQYDRIETIPMAVRTLARRLGAVGKAGGLDSFTVEEARRFYPGISRMSADEFGKLTPNMQRLVGQLKGTLDQTIKASADVVGKGAQYASGMKEYAMAGKLTGLVNNNMKPAMAKALRYLLGGTAAGAGYEVGKTLID